MQAKVLRRVPVMIALLLLAVPALAGDRPSRQYTIEQFVRTVSVGGASFSADESRILFHSNASGVPNVMSVPTAGGPATAITQSQESTYAVAWFPQDDRLLYTRDEGGNELNHLYVRELDGQERDLTPGANLKAEFAGFTPDGSAFHVATNEREPRAFDVYRYDTKTYARRIVFENQLNVYPGPLSRDGRYIALTRPQTSSENEMLLLDLQTSKLVTVSDSRGSWEPQYFDIAGQWLYYLSNAGGEFSRVRRYEITTGRHEEVATYPWDVMYTDLSHDGRYTVTAINQDARTVLSIVETATGRPLQLPALPPGDIASVSISRSEKRVALYLSGDRSPRNLYAFTIGDATAVQLTDTQNPEIDPADLVDSTIERFKARDGLEIPNVLFRPLQASATSRAPAIVWVHGGPGGQTRQGYSAVLQYLANHGYVVLGINNRGSSGYGQTFFTADDQKHGREPLWDCVDAKRWLARQDYVDPERIAIVGGSYGGYMVAAALAFEPDEFTAGVNIFGVTNWIRTLESIPAWWEAQRQALYQEIGDPVKQRDLLQAISPLFHAGNIRRPLMVLQGANDPRVLQVESDEIVAAVRRNGVPVEYVVFPDEGHGFSKIPNQIEGYGRMLAFLDRHVKGAGH